MKNDSNANFLDLAARIKWVFVANRAEAVVFKQGPGQQVTFIDRIPNPEGKPSESEISPDSAIRHGLDRRSAQHEEVALRFARQLGEFLHQAKSTQRYEGLILVAEPHFLGLLRKELTPQVRACVIDHIPKALTPGTEAQVRETILQMMA